jgi:hypothetical protein
MIVVVRGCLLDINVFESNVERVTFSFLVLVFCMYFGFKHTISISSDYDFVE